MKKDKYLERLKELCPQNHSLRVNCLEDKEPSSVRAVRLKANTAKVTTSGSDNQEVNGHLTDINGHSDKESLSDKIFYLDTGMSRGRNRLQRPRSLKAKPRIYVKDVKEFIKKLKRFIEIIRETCPDVKNDPVLEEAKDLVFGMLKRIDMRIDKLAGKELI